MNGGCVFVVVVVVVVVTHFLRAPCFKTGYAGSAGNIYNSLEKILQIRNAIILNFKSGKVKEKEITYKNFLKTKK